MAVGKYLEASNKEKTKEAIKKLMQLAPDTAVLADENGEWEGPLSMIKVGDTVSVTVLSVDEKRKRISLSMKQAKHK